MSVDLIGWLLVLAVVVVTLRIWLPPIHHGGGVHPGINNRPALRPPLPPGPPPRGGAGVAVNRTTPRR